MKAGDYTIYLDYVVLGQSIPVKNLPKDLDNYDLKSNDVFIYLPQYNIENGLFQSIKKWLAYIMIKGTLTRFFILMGRMKKKAKFYI